MHRKETKLSNKRPDVSFHSDTPCGVDHAIYIKCPPPLFLHLMLHTNFVKINMKVTRRNKNRSTVYNQHCEYKVLWYTIYVIVRRESYFMQVA